MLYPYAHVRMRALKGLASRARVTPAISRASLYSSEAVAAAQVILRILLSQLPKTCRCRTPYYDSSFIELRKGCSSFALPSVAGVAFFALVVPRVYWTDAARLH